MIRTKEKSIWLNNIFEKQKKKSDGIFTRIYELVEHARREHALKLVQAYKSAIEAIEKKYDILRMYNQSITAFRLKAEGLIQHSSLSQNDIDGLNVLAEEMNARKNWLHSHSQIDISSTLTDDSIEQTIASKIMPNLNRELLSNMSSSDNKNYSYTYKEELLKTKEEPK